MHWDWLAIAVELNILFFQFSVETYDIKKFMSMRPKTIHKMSLTDNSNQTIPNDSSDLSFTGNCHLEKLALV